MIKGLRAVGAISLSDEACVRQVPMRVRAVDAHQDVVNEGARLRECCLVLEGFFFRHRIVAGGRRQILSFHLPGELPDLAGMHLAAIDYSLGALTGGHVAFIAHTALRGLIARAPSVGDLLWRYTQREAAIHRAWLASIGCRSAYQRVAHLFCELYVRMRTLGLAEETGFTLPLTQTELGEALGLSAVHINRTLQQLRHDGVIVSRGRYHGFCDWERLRRAGEFDSSYLFQTVEV
jgi:CRP-like cAMP-binding protein